MARTTKDSSVPSEPEAVYQLKVTLDGIRPSIWRRIQVRGDITASALPHRRTAVERADTTMY